MADLIIAATYDVTTTSSPTKLFDAEYYFSSAFLEDGTEIDAQDSTYYFTGTGLTTVYFTLSGYTNLPDRLFYGCTRLFGVVLPEGVVDLGQYCFGNCTALEYIHLSSSVALLDNFCFYNCSALKYIVGKGMTEPYMEAGVFRYIGTDGILYIQEGADYTEMESSDNYQLGYYDWTSENIPEIASTGLTAGYETKYVEGNSTYAYLPVIASGTSLESISYSTAGSFTLAAEPYGEDNIRISFSKNTSENTRTASINLTLTDEGGNNYTQTVSIGQLPGGTGETPGSWTAATDTAYTWYSDSAMLYVAPSLRSLTYNDSTALYLVTAHTFDTLEVRTSGDVTFEYVVSAETDNSSSSHDIYIITEDNSTTGIQSCDIKVVAYSGSSAFSATTTLVKTPQSDGFISVSPNPVKAGIYATAITSYVTLTNCSRDVATELSNNTQLTDIDWLTVNVGNDGSIQFTFDDNTGYTQSFIPGTTRSTYYDVYGLDSANRTVFRRIEITQKGAEVTITPATYSLSNTSGSSSAAISANMGGTFSFSASSCITITSYVADNLSGGTLYFDYTTNDEESRRYGYIWVTEQVIDEPYVLSAYTVLVQREAGPDGYIQVSPQSVTVDKESGTTSFNVTYDYLDNTPTLIEGEGTMDITDYDFDGSVVTVTYGENPSAVTRTKTFTLTALTTDNETVSATILIRQNGQNAPFSPIWKDYGITVDAPSKNYINYTISFDGEVIYTGRAYAFNDDDTITFYLNQVVKNYLSNDIDFTLGFQTVEDWLGNFSVVSSELGEIANVAFFEDYSYTNRSLSNVNTLNNPITNEVVEGSPIPFSFFVCGSTGSLDVTWSSSASTGVVTSMTISDNEQHRYFVEAEPGKTYSAAGATYKAIPSCHARYSLYYTNSFGGVDVLPLRGKSHLRTDNITWYNYNRSYVNDSREFENVTYMNEIKPSWELQTGWITDEQSWKMRELLESTIVYLYDAEEQTFTPVVMTSKSLDFKTFMNQGRKMYDYIINVTESQTKERR